METSNTVRPSNRQENKMITMRSQLEMRWSTSPDDMGYGYKPAPELLGGKPSTRGTPRAILNAVADVRRRIGPGTYLRVEILHHGEIIPLDQVKDLIWNSDNILEYRR
jgi:hypothetical protein